MQDFIQSHYPELSIGLLFVIALVGVFRTYVLMNIFEQLQWFQSYANLSHNDLIETLKKTQSSR